MTLLREATGEVAHTATYQDPTRLRGETTLLGYVASSPDPKALEALRILAEKPGFDPNQEVYSRHTALRIMGWSGNPESLPMYKLLFEKGANPNLSHDKESELAGLALNNFNYNHKDAAEILATFIRNGARMVDRFMRKFTDHRSFGELSEMAVELAEHIIKYRQQMMADSTAPGLHPDTGSAAPLGGGGVGVEKGK